MVGYVPWACGLLYGMVNTLRVLPASVYRDNDNIVYMHYLYLGFVVRKVSTIDNGRK